MSRMRFFFFFVRVLGIEIVFMRPSKGLDPIGDIKTSSDVNKKPCAQYGEVESRCKSC